MLVIVLLLAVGSAAAQTPPDADVVNTTLASGNQAVTVGDLLLDEPFDDADAWETFKSDSVSLKVSKGAYRMFESGRGVTWGLNDDLHSDVVFQAEVTHNSLAEDNSYGVMCRADTSNNSAGYYLEISANGFGSITKSTGDEFITLADWTESSAIRTGQNTNEITAVCVGEYLALYANGELIVEARDSDFTEGFAGLSATSYNEDGEVDVSYDNVRIWEASFGSGGTSDLPATLVNFGGRSEDAIEELEDLGIIPTGSTLIFGEDFAFFSGQGNWFQPLARNLPRKNIVFAGELTYIVGSTDDFEICSLTSRINTNNQGSATTYVDMGLLNDGSVAIVDRFAENENSNFAVSSFTVDLDEPHHLMLIMIDDVAHVYIDGQLAIADFQVDERAGSYGIALTGQGPDARCEGRDIWAYQVPSTTPGVCTVSSSRNVNKRSGPGTNFSSPGQLSAGEEAVVIGQTVGGDGQTWWKLEDESWVREDVVTANGDCASVPTAK
jgi:hypothetical protein